MSRSISTGTDDTGRQLLAALGDAPFIFVVGKGGTGKTTAAGAIAIALTDAGTRAHLLSTDPAHSVGDLFGQPLHELPVPAACVPDLLLEELDAAAASRRWLDRTAGPVAGIIEAGTYLDGEDVAGLTRLALPGVDEMMALLRLLELLGAGRRVVVDTAPTGHTLRLLDAADTHEGLARALRAMADKAAAVASSLARRPVRLAGESVIEGFERDVQRFRSQVLGAAAFVISARDEELVHAETQRLAAALQTRGLHRAATVVAGDVSSDRLPYAEASCFGVPRLEDPRGCDGLRAWLRALQPCAPQSHAAADAPATGPATPVRRAASDAGSAAEWLADSRLRVLLFAGKGGVGKTTCAAAAAVLLAGSRDVLLCSADPAGSLDDVFGRAVTAAGRAGRRLRVQQVDAGAELARWRSRYRDELLAALDRIGLSESAALDRRVVETLLELAPPGVDELAALAAMLDAAASHETVILDTAPTGHLLRLLGMPELALDWTRQLMRLIVKYGAAGAAAGTAETLLRTARELRSLQQLLHDPRRTGVIVVALDEPLVLAETDRLLDTLDQAGVPVAARILNRAASVAVRPRVRTFQARQRTPPPVGDEALRAFVESWSMVT